jgi:hypothetical protein
MTNLIVVEVTTKADWKNFLQLPWKIYGNDLNWVPPLLMEQRRLLNRKKNPIFKHCIYQAWIVYKQNKVAGRIIAYIDSVWNHSYQEKTGFLGFFESINSQDVADGLFNMSLNWLKCEKATKVFGPINFSIANECGVLISGFATPPTIQMGHTPPYYSLLFENAGFNKAHDLYAYLMTSENVDQQQNLLPRLKLITERLKQKEGIILRTINMKDYKNELIHINTLYNSFMAYNWGFTPSTIEEMLYVGETMKMIVDPELIYFAEVNGVVVGCSLSIPDFNQVLIHINGKLFPFGIFKMFYYKRRINKIRTMLLGIDEKYRSKGLDILFYYHTIKQGLHRGYNAGELSWISEDNKVLLSIVEKMGAERYKVYRMYQKVL